MYTPVPARVVRAYLAQPDETPAAIALAARAGLTFEYDEAALRATMRITGPSDTDGSSESYLLDAGFDGFRAIPPVWRFLDPRNGSEVGPAAYPRPVGNSVLHGNGLVCAHWSRHAYKTFNGPHEDWGPPSNWRNAKSGNTTAFTVSDMLDRLIREVARSRGRMAKLPEL